jgi:hypothetical protein
MELNEYKIIHKSPHPKVLVITPLLPFHEVSKDTKRSIKRNKTPFIWITSKGDNNIAKNLKNGLDWYYWHGVMTPYYIMIDSDIELGRHMIDRLVKKLGSQKPNIAFAYASFKFKGEMNREFPAERYDINRLMQHNYISSNSLFKSDITQRVGLVTDDKYKRLLDWAFLLKLYEHGYYGAPCPEANFVAKSSMKDVSAGGLEDYNIKRDRVIKDFVEPLPLMRK